VSAGIASSVPALSTEPITATADRAMFAAKRAGRNRTVAIEIPGPVSRPAAVRSG
jgi:PleD family two-component response regulator